MLSEQQIDDIAFYCYLRNVQYYDVQMELVDHIAGLIEDLQQRNPGLSFKEALNEAGAQFSQSEFKEMEKSKTRVINSKVSKLIEIELRNFFTFPRIMLTVSMLLLAYYIPIIRNINKTAGLWLLLLLVLPSVFYGIVYNKKIREFAEDRKGNLLCLKVRSKYEVLAWTYILALNLFLNGGNAFFDIHIQSQLAFQLILISAVLVEILYIAILFVRLSFNAQMKQLYPKAFALP